MRPLFYFLYIKKRQMAAGPGNLLNNLSTLKGNSRKLGQKTSCRRPKRRGRKEFIVWSRWTWRERSSHCSSTFPPSATFSSLSPPLHLPLLPALVHHHVIWSHKCTSPPLLSSAIWHCLIKLVFPRYQTEKERENRGGRENANSIN